MTQQFLRELREELDAVSPAELCCHTLLIDDGSRHRSYCLLLSHVDVDDDRLPKWDEFQELAADYEV